MPVTVTYDSSDRLLMVSATGEATPELFREAMAAITSSSAHPPDTDALWDLRDLDLSRTDGRFAAALHSIRNGDFPARRRARVALVVGTDLQFGVGRQFELLAGDEDARMAVFRSPGEARAWLRGP